MSTAAIAAAVIAVLVVALLGYAFVESRRIHIVHRTLKSPRLPAAFHGTRVVFLTDVHAGPYFGPGQMAALVRRVNELAPDILLLGGDNVGGGRGSGAKVFYPAAGELRAPLGKFAVLGNHDVWEGRAEAVDGLHGAGFTLLENESVAVELQGQRIFIAGIDDLYTGRPDAKAAAASVPDGQFAILLAHNPDVFHEVIPATQGVWDLAVAGHTHGGQLTVFGKFAPIVPSGFGDRYRTGWRTEAGTPILVSNGVGTVTAPVRLMARPQIHVIELERTADSAQPSDEQGGSAIN